MCNPDYVMLMAFNNDKKKISCYPPTYHYLTVILWILINAMILLNALYEWHWEISRISWVIN